MTAWHWHPEVVLGLASLVGLYSVGIGRWRRRYGWGPPASRARIAAFGGGVVALAVALTGPLAEWAEHHALSAHMVQHLLLTLVVPPLWLLGTPGWLLRPLLRLPGIGWAGYRLTRPVVALPLATATLVFWHLPSFYDAALRYGALHALEHVTLLATAFLAWWPITGSLPDWPRPAAPVQLLYLLLCTLPMSAVAAPITAAPELLYPFYEAAATSWPLSPQADQQLAGVLMWVGGMLGYLVAGTVVFFRWALEEEREPAHAALEGRPS